jgi:hypothetical protein
LIKDLFRRLTGLSLIVLPMLLVLGGSPVTVAAPAGPFADFDGSWSGEGTVTLESGSKERLRCRATYRVRGVSAADLDLKLICASDSYKFDFVGNARANDVGTISGQWSETSRNVGGSVSGTARGNRIQVLIESQAFSADLMMITRGARQSVSMQSRAAGEKVAVAITLRRQSR